MLQIDRVIERPHQFLSHCFTTITNHNCTFINLWYFVCFRLSGCVHYVIDSAIYLQSTVLFIKAQIESFLLCCSNITRNTDLDTFCLGCMGRRPKEGCYHKTACLKVKFIFGLLFRKWSKALTLDLCFKGKTQGHFVIELNKRGILGSAEMCRNNF